MNKSDVIVVTGVTGSQGGAAARCLVQAGWQVRGLTRNLKSKKAVEMTRVGVKLVQGDMGNRASLERAFEGAYGAYIVTAFVLNAGSEKEIEHGKLSCEVAHKAGVKHLVFASVGSADRNTGVPHFDAKWIIEKHIEQLGIPATILRPTIFMEDLTESKYVPPAVWGMMRKILGDNKPVQWISVDDIGAVVAKVFSDPDSFLGQKLTLTGDSKSMAEARNIFKLVKGKGPFGFSMPDWLFRRMVSDELVTMWHWLNNVGFEGDVEITRKVHPGLMNMETWLKHKMTKRP